MKSSSRVTLKRTPPPTSAASRSRAARSSGWSDTLRVAVARGALYAAALGALDRRDAGVSLLEQGHFARGERARRLSGRRRRLLRAGDGAFIGAGGAPRFAVEGALAPGLGSGSLRSPARSSNGPNAVPIGAGFFGCGGGSDVPCLRFLRAMRASLARLARAAHRRLFGP